MNRLETLKSALSARNDEVESYQVNIDNYVRAIEKINAQYSENIDMLQFRDQLADLLNSSRREQLKAIVIRDVIAEQVSELEAK